MKTVVPAPKATTKRPRPSVASGTVTMEKAKPTKAKPTKASAATKKATTTKKAPVNATTTTTGAVTVRRPKLIWRTRDQENSLLYNLQLDVASLQSELQGLRAFRTMLMGRALNRQDDLDGSFVRTVREYFRVFRHGYTPDPHPHQLRQRPRALPSSVESVTSPDEFLRFAMDEDVSSGRFAGLAVIMKQWERYSSVLGPMTLSFMDSQIISTFRGSGEGQDQVLVTSRAQYQLYISLRTIEIMFPHVLSHQEIVTQILGRCISGVGKFDFVFNTANTRIVRYEFSLDLTQSFVDLLGNPAMVAVLLKDALISDEFFIGDLSEFVPDRSEPSRVEEMEAEGEAVDTAPPQDEPKRAHMRPWKMTLSSILCAVDGEGDADDDHSNDDDVVMDEREPHAERAPDEDHGHHVQVQFEPV